MTREWIKKANKIGVYKGSYKGFRIYRVKEVEVKERLEEREDGGPTGQALPKAGI
jgi:hypothetical protein